LKRFGRRRFFLTSNKNKQILSKILMLMLPFVIVVFITLFVIMNTLKESLGFIPELFLNKFTLKYYLELFNDQIFFKSLIYSFYVALISTILSTVVGTYLGYIVTKSKGVLNNIIYRFPILLSYIAAASLIYSTYSDKGFLYHIFLIFGLKLNLDIIYNTNGIAVILLNMFKGIPFIAFSVCPIFMNVESSYKEIAKNLGCSNLAYIFKVLLPMSKQSIITSCLIIFNYNLFTYEGFYFLGPSNPVSIGVFSYETYINPDMTSRALGMAINMIMIVLSLILCALYYKIIKNNHHNIR
jgi:putative spermidine/putrescine transport system permease protein